MNQDVKQKWVTALRSGEYKQTGGRLRKGDCYCCLGVLTDLYDKDKDKDIKCHAWHEEHGLYFYESDGVTVEATLPESVMKWADLDEPNPVVREDRKRYFDKKLEELGEHLSIDQAICKTSLAYLNDNEGLDFNQLADIIEAQL
jgi:hypothetical protein